MSKQTCTDELILNDDTLIQRYVFKKKIGEGCFGKIFQVFNKVNHQNVALKVEIVKNEDVKKVMVQNQYHILSLLSNISEIPKVYHIGSWKYGRFIEMQLLGINFAQYIKEKENIQKIQFFIIVHQILSIFQKIHSMNILHRDIKPENIMEKNGKFYLIDFGISKLYKSFACERKSLRGFVGTPRYASIRAHQGLQQSPKDDLQSLFYVFAHCFHKTLPWMKLPPGHSRTQLIMKIKLEKSQGLFAKMGNSFYQAHKHIKNLDSGEYPDYQYLLSLFPKQKHRNSLNFTNSQRNNNKKLSLPNNFQDLNKLDRKYTISKVKQVINLNQNSKNSIGTIIINWVNKQSINSQSQKDQLQKQLLKPGNNDQLSLEENISFSDDDCNIQPILPKIHSIIVNCSPFT